LDPPAVPVTRQPVEDRAGGRPQTIVGRHAQLDERDEAPVGPAPLLIRVNAKASVTLLPAQEPAHERPGEDLVAVRHHVLTENVAPREIPNRRLL
jgi:hypothetical protein